MRKSTTIPIVLLCSLMIASITATAGFDPASILPSGAVIYAETSDLPALIDKWEKSPTAERYLESPNLREYSNRRLGIRLAERWREFSDGLGTSADLTFVRSFSDKRAAIAVYDIGKLDLVMVAPVSSAVFEASVLFASKSRFEEKTSPSGTRYFETSFMTDRDRREQKIFFAMISGDLVVATDEKLFKQAEANIKGIDPRASLSGEADFQALVRQNSNSLLRVWVDQKALNRDFYFRKYWLGETGNRLKNIRAGVFTIEFAGNELRERRRLLLSTPSGEGTIDGRVLSSLRRFAPEESAFVRLAAAGPADAANAVLGSTFGDKGTRSAPAPGLNLYDTSDFLGDDDFYSGYYGMDSRFEVMIDEPEEEPGRSPLRSNQINSAGLAAVFQRAGVLGLLNVGDPVSLPLPLFAEMRWGGLVRTSRPVDSASFEAAVIRIANREAGVSGLDLDLSWKNEKQGDSLMRTLELPMLGREFTYAQKGGSLLFANSRELLASMLTRGEGEWTAVSGSPASTVTILNVGRGKQAFGEIFKRLEPKNEGWDLFSGEIAGLLEVASELRTVRIERRPNGRLVDQEIVFSSE